MTASRHSASNLTVACVLSFFLLMLPVAPAIAQAMPTEIGLEAVRLLAPQQAPNAALYLQGDNTSEWWEVASRVPGKSEQPSGSFRVHHRSDIPVEKDMTRTRLIEERGLLRYDRSMVVGTHYEADGSTRNVSGMLLDIALANEDGTESAETVFVPLVESESLAKLEQIAVRTAYALQQPAERELTPPTVPREPKLGGEFHKSSHTAECRDDQQFDLNLCTLEFVGCTGIVTGGALACILACPATGPAAIACLVACGVVDVSGILVCLVQNIRCELQVERDYEECLQDCEASGGDW